MIIDKEKIINPNIAPCIGEFWEAYFLASKVQFLFFEVGLLPNINSKLPNMFVQIAKCICPNCQIYLSKLPNVFVQELFGDYIMSPKFVSGTSLPPRTLRTSCLLSEEIL